MKKKNKISRTAAAVIMAAAVGLTGTVPAVYLAAQPEKAAKAAESTKETAAGKKADAGTGKIWETDIRLGIRTERQLMEEAGFTLDEWDDMTAKARKEGFEQAFDRETLAGKDADARILEENGCIYFISSTALEKVKDTAAAYRLAYRLVPLLGGSEDTDLRLWTRLEENGKKVYLFQQVSDGEEILGSTLKIAVNENDDVTAVFNSLAPGTSKKENLVTREQAEAAVLEHMRQEGTVMQIFPELTERINYQPLDLETGLNMDEETDPVPEKVLWVVYSFNGATMEEALQQETYVNIAHYVSLDGTYLFSLPVRIAGDEESRSGYRKQDVFAGMTQDEWSGEITDVKGGTRNVTIPVLYSETEGRWYLGDMKRRIAVADFAEAAYGEDHAIKLVESRTNDDWDNEDLYMMYNYIRSWDFYADMGWKGPDGQGTDVIILKDMCFSDGKPYENACSAGKIENYQMFGYTARTVGIAEAAEHFLTEESETETGTENGKDTGEKKPLGIVQGMDVLAHEYTHTFTAAMMNDNLYENDQGAINEAMSDIMGNLAEFISGDTNDKRWLLGENTGNVIRDMSDPSNCQQPEYVWDINYGPHTDNPAEANDRGGVHFNSSLLNRIGALLCMDEGMSYEDAVSLWTMTAMGMTPKTDYVQIKALLHWAAAESGNEKYIPAIDELAEKEKLDCTGIPEDLPDDRKVVRLRLPDTDAFRDDNWLLQVVQPNTHILRDLGREALSMLLNYSEDDERYEAVVTVFRYLTHHLKFDGMKLELEEPDDKEELDEAVKEIIRGVLGKAVFSSVSWRSADSDEIVMTLTQNPSFYVLINVGGTGADINGLAMLINDRWYDVGSFLDRLQDLIDKTEGLAAMDPENPDEAQIMEFITQIRDMGGAFLDVFFREEAPEDEQASVAEGEELIPTAGLENILLFDH